ncbi:hypothetical protein D3C86_1769710 [compost metagenome]
MRVAALDRSPFVADQLIDDLFVDTCGGQHRPPVVSQRMESEVLIQLDARVLAQPREAQARKIAGPPFSSLNELREQKALSTMGIITSRFPLTKAARTVSRLRLLNAARAATTSGANGARGAHWMGCRPFWWGPSASS